MRLTPYSTRGGGGGLSSEWVESVSRVFSPDLAVGKGGAGVEVPCRLALEVGVVNPAGPVGEGWVPYL